MKSLPNKPFGTSRALSMACSCLILGLLLTPLAYIAIGGLGGFSTEFSLISLPLLAFSILFLLFRFFGKKTPDKSFNLRHAIEVICWLLIIAFLFFVSNFTLLTAFERIGLFTALFIACAIISIPILAILQSALVKRVEAWPRAWTVAVQLAIGIPAIILTAAYLFTATASL